MDHKDPRNGVPGLPEEPADSAPAVLGAEDGTAPLPRVQRQPLAVETSEDRTTRIVQLVAGDYLVTLNPVDGSEITTCPPDGRPAPVRRTPQDRAAVREAARPAAPAGPRGPELPLLEREEERERLTRLLSRGCSVRVTGASGAGRSVLLDSVAEACAGLAPDGVVRLTGYRRTPSDLLQELYTAVYDTEEMPYRPDRARLLGLLRDVGAVVVVDDLEFGGAALDDLLASAPECAFLLSATPDIGAPSPESAVEELFLPGLTRIACLELLERAVERPLEEEEAAWAADLWFESEGLPLRFVQAGALLRRRDAQGIESLRGDQSVWGEMESADAGTDADAGAEDAGPAEDAPHDAVPAGHIPLPSLAESAAPAQLLASSMSEAAREALRFAVALGGEIPHQAHLPALVGDTHGDAALGALVNAGLAVPVAAHYRLAAGVRQQLTAASDAPDEGLAPQAHTAAQHYAWWAGHPSVTPDRVAAEAEAILAALAACRDGGHASAAVLLARTAAPVLAAAMHWSAWERTLRIGQEAARLSGEVAEEAYFHHELGVLALCTGSLDRARTELEASIALRGALADRQGTTVGRRTLALVVDRSGGPVLRTTSGAETRPLAPLGGPSGAGLDASALPGGGLGPSTLIGKRHTFSAPRRNLAAACAGALLAAVLGTIVTLGTTANSGDTNNPMNVKPVESAQQDEADNGLPAASDTPGTTQQPSPADSGTTPGATTPGATGGMGWETTTSGASSGSGSTSTGSGSSAGSSSSSRTPTGSPTKPSSAPTTPTSPPASPTDTATGTPTTTATGTPTTTNSASEPVSSGPVSGSDSAVPSESTAGAIA